MEAFESIDRECAALGGLFQHVVNDLKTGVPHYEDFISKAGKLHSQLKNTILALGSFLDTFQKIADAATNTKGATREIGSCLTRIVLRHKSMESRMKTLCSALLDCMVLPLQDKMEEWKKVASCLDKDHSKEYKKLRTELKKKSDNATRILKKHKKSKGSESDPKLDQALAEVNKHARNLHETEKVAVRKILIEERSRYCMFISCLKPVLSEEISMVAELQQLEEVMVKLEKHTEDPFKLPEASEQVLTDVKTGGGAVVFQTPPSSPSSLGSRKSSMCSISSAGSGSTGSSNSPSHQAHIIKNRQGVGNLVGPMRLSSISSQDSGFTSQDTLFLRPGSPHRSKTPNGSDQDLSGSGGSTPGAGWPGLAPGMPGPPLSDRPHTISTAYDKGHQRPALQPYTFNKPERIREEEERPYSTNPGYEEPIYCRPPVPQRCGSLDRPNVPTRPPNQRILQNTPISQNPNGLPNFACNQPDMGVPAPAPLLPPFRVPAVPQGHQAGVRGSLQRPYSFTHGVIPEVAFSEALGAQLGLRGGGTILRRSMSQAAGKPPPPIRRVSAASQDGGRDDDVEPGSNSTTPRGSMEFLPPPPPHLLHSDEDDEDEGKRGGDIEGRRGLSVADSVRELQRRQSTQSPRQSSPATLRRVQSMSSPSPMSSISDRSQIKARLDAALSSPRGPRPISPGSNEQIYAPVAALQQKIQAQQQNKMALGHTEPGMVPHPPGPQIAPQHFQQPNSQFQYQQHQQFQQQQQQYQQQNGQQLYNSNGQLYNGQQQFNQQQHPNQHQQQYNANGSPEGEQYGFGMQFQLHSKNWYKHQQHQYHDQIMQDMDPTLGQRPQPPDINGHAWPNNGPPRGPNLPPAQFEHSAMRVRQWIETRTVSDVRRVRPILNQEIQRGFSLKKTNEVNDRSKPRF
ncbi:mediator of RNA polymerase II transcription subunit 12 isoform X3 [Eurytemora carolleeae]|uniref:mediator of RNA polymerase II transcription subunit 12 isoform X3 n=1 Tax=Eurytemora carolleeae TaxID=1294199 RepID=UPI000C776C50|nr:mediator of RNA polymerase II transcription subunit 12 isoform X3 [Eurytemora carolleeae]|eukprot:XP_023327809.1 mediator of RNA polymerase II transcription subunit 12-like isoform X3 [Eurytemora affinis]